MHTLTFTLKQHTPIIHFQHQHAGATLRATEVKPKLDRFILTRLGNGLTTDGRYKNGIEIAKSKNWLIGRGEHPALDYKLSISTVPCRKIIIANRMVGGRPGQREALNNAGYDCVEFSPYFAQEKEFGELFDNDKFEEGGRRYNSFSVKEDFTERVNNLKTIGLLAPSDIQVTIFCFRRELRTEIEKNREAFFASHNFGTRQSKGFGCFLPAGMTDGNILAGLKANPSIKGVFRVDSGSNYKEKLKKINDDYSILKRGESFGPYIKSRLWQYMCDNNEVNWEKRAIKLYIKENVPTLFAKLKTDPKKAVHFAGHHVDSCNTNGNNYYIRALLGLAEQYEFMKTDNTRLKIRIEDSLKYSGNDQLKAESVDRFTSPVRYLITDSSIFMTTTEIPDELIFYLQDGKRVNRKFRFSINEIGPDSAINLPLPSQFNLEHFITAQAGYGRNLK